MQLRGNIGLHSRVSVLCRFPCGCTFREELITFY
nr:MAG TPA: hypothetical protein [Caudoviricetes sp.]